MTREIAHTRVYRGATVLDRLVPGWEHKVNTEALDMVTSDSCVLGQCFQGYSLGLRRLSLCEDEAVFLGFTLSAQEVQESYEDDCLAGFRFLREAWVCEVESRLS